MKRLASFSLSHQFVLQDTHVPVIALLIKVNEGSFMATYSTIC